MESTFQAALKEEGPLLLREAPPTTPPRSPPPLVFTQNWRLLCPKSRLLEGTAMGQLGLLGGKHGLTSSFSSPIRESGRYACELEISLQVQG